jgi:hypothetical protein
MSSRSDDEEMKQESSEDDSRTLVAALTQQLLLDDPPAQPNTTSVPAPLFQKDIGLDTGNLASKRDTDRDHQGEEEGDLPLPGFLAEAEVRLAIRRATTLQTQGPFHDAPSPYFSPHWFNIHASNARERGEPMLRPIFIHLSDLLVTLPPLTCLFLLLISTPESRPLKVRVFRRGSRQEKNPSRC